MPFSSSQLLELFVLYCIVDHFRNDISKCWSAASLAESTGGPVRHDSMPTRLYDLITPLQTVAYVLVPVVYIITIVTSRLEQPQWLNALALPDVPFGAVSGADADFWKNALRVLACAVSINLQALSDSALKHLGNQFHTIGRRENSRVVQTGPYAYVRHPLYSMVLLQELLWAVMFWSYAPLFAFVVTAAIFVVKIPLEEEAIHRDGKVQGEYRAYMRKVPAKLVPRVW